MDGFAIAQWAAVGIIAIGLVATWLRNNRSQGKHQGILETEIKNINDKLEDENTGLGAIKKCVDDQKVYCARISSGYGERIKDLEEKNR